MKTKAELLEACIHKKLDGESTLNLRYYLKVMRADEQVQNAIFQELKKYDYEANRIKENKLAFANLTRGLKFLIIGVFLCMVYYSINHFQIKPLTLYVTPESYKASPHILAGIAGVYLVLVGAILVSRSLFRYARIFRNKEIEKKKSDHFIK